jgi:N-acetylmuramoyl-L-alanine amidase
VYVITYCSHFQYLYKDNESSVDIYHVIETGEENKMFAVRRSNNMRWILVLIAAVLFTLSFHVKTFAMSSQEAKKQVQAAENHATALKWQISVEYTKTVKYPDMKVYNATKTAKDKAQQAVNALPASSVKSELQTRITNNVQLHLSRAQGYIDAITSGKKISQKKSTFENYYSQNPASDSAESAYHAMSSEIRKQAVLLYRVYGQTTRAAILNTYKAPAENVKNKTMNAITVKMKLDDLAAAKAKGQTSVVQSLTAEINKMLVLLPAKEKAIFTNLLNPAQTTERYATVNANSLNVRTGPSTGYSIIGKLNTGDRVTVTSQSGDWVFIKGVLTGYVHSAYLTFDGTSGTLKGQTIVIDAGHGAKDPGAVANGLKEKDVVLDVALRVQKKLTDAGARVVMTRSTDVFLELEERAAIANQSGGSAFVSIHANAAASTAYGTETYYNSEYQKEKSLELATNIQSNMIKTLGTRDRGVKEAGFYVIKYTRVPSVLVELGFITNSDEAARMATSTFREQAASAIVEGLKQYYQ